MPLPPSQKAVPKEIMLTAMTRAPMICRGRRPNRSTVKMATTVNVRLTRTDNDRLQQRSVGGHAHALEDIRGVVEHNVDSDKLLKYGQHKPDENDKSAE